MNHSITFLSLYIICNSLTSYAMTPEDKLNQPFKNISFSTCLEMHVSSSATTQSDSKNNFFDSSSDISRREAVLATRSVTPNRLDFLRRSNETMPHDEQRSQSYSCPEQPYKKNILLYSLSHATPSTESTQTTPTRSSSAPRSGSEYSWRSYNVDGYDSDDGICG